jgi:hypothetical protein
MIHFKVVSWHVYGGTEERHDVYISTVDPLAMIRTVHLPNTSQKCYCLSQLAQFIIIKNILNKAFVCLLRIVLVVTHSPIQEY